MRHDAQPALLLLGRPVNCHQTAVCCPALWRQQCGLQQIFGRTHCHCALPNPRLSCEDCKSVGMKPYDYLLLHTCCVQEAWMNPESRPPARAKMSGLRGPFHKQAHAPFKYINVPHHLRTTTKHHNRMFTMNIHCVTS